MSNPLSVFDVHLAADGMRAYHNALISSVNDHVIRISVMTEPFYWHYHPNSDESFLVVEGVLCVDLDDRTVELGVGQGLTVPAGTKHRTWPKGGRSVNVTVEKADMETVSY